MEPKSNYAKKINEKSSVVVTDGMFNFGIPSRMSIAAVVADIHEFDSWKRRAHDFLGRQWVQFILTSLLILDVLIIFVEMYLMIEYPMCRMIERDCLACCPGNEFEGGQNERWLTDEVCQDGYEETGVAACDNHNNHTVHIIEDVLFYSTISILV